MQQQLNFKIPIPKHFNDLQKFQQTPTRTKKSDSYTQQMKQSAERNNSIYTSPEFFKNILQKKFCEEQSPIEVQKTVIQQKKSPFTYPLINPIGTGYILKENMYHKQQKKPQLYQSPSIKQYKPTSSIHTPNKTDEDKVILSKFKLFFKSIMQNQSNQQQMASIWQQFQKSVHNPFQFDQFIEKTNKDCKKKLQIKSMTNINTAPDLQTLKQKRQKMKERKQSLQLTEKKQNKTTHFKTKNRAKSQNHKQVRNNNWKQPIQKEMKQITKIFLHGKEVIKDKFIMGSQQFRSKY